MLFDNPNKKKIDQTVLEEKIGTGPKDLPYEFTPSWKFLAYGDTPKERAAFEYMKKIIAKGRPLIDLGCGFVIENDIMIEAAARLGLPAYIGIDLHNVGRKRKPDLFANRLNEEDEFNVEQLKKRLSNISITLIKADILTFVSHMAPGVYNFTINGLDANILGTPYEYSKVLAQELGRVCLAGSIIFGASSVVLRYLEKEGFKPIYVKDEDSWLLSVYRNEQSGIIFKK